ncbi:1514_t:CDS:1, partial [Funneliformis caledonium]
NFAGVTEYLDGSNYILISLMFSLLTIFSQKIISDAEIEVIDLTSPNTVFDDNVSYKDAPEDEPITQQPKHRKLVQDYFNLENHVKIALYQSINYY